MKAPTFEEIKRLSNQKSQVAFEGRMKEITGVFLDFKGSSEEIINQFLEFTQKVGKDYIFASVQYVCGGEHEVFKEMYTINTDIMTSDDYGNTYKKILKDVRKYNEEILKLPIDEPASVVLFLNDGFTFYHCGIVSEWAQILKEADDALSEICENYQEDLDKIKMDKKNEETNQKYKRLEEVEKILLKDETFKSCTTKPARVACLEQILAQQGMLEVFGKTRWEMEGFADLIWAKLKKGLK